MRRLYRYVFYRVLRLQRRKIPDHREAALSALIFMCFTPMALQAFVDIFASKAFGTVLLIEYLGKWPYAIIVFSVIFLLHYLALGNKRKMAEVDREFRGADVYGKWGTWIVVSYFVIPFLLLGALIAS